jgi:hypothetical protein
MKLKKEIRTQERQMEAKSLQKRRLKNSSGMSS